MDRCCVSTDAVRKVILRGPAEEGAKKAAKNMKVTAGSKAPLELSLDMPAGDASTFAGPPPDPSKVVIPPLPTLVHDKAFFDDVHGHGFHGGLLDGLAAFYKN